MFNDFRNTSRDTWKFTYFGRELLRFAAKKYKSYTEREMESRNKMAEMLRDPNCRSTDQRIEDLKKDIEFCGNEREKCAVWVHEFSRNEDREFHLSLGDVTYFDIAQLPGEAKLSELLPE